MNPEELARAARRLRDDPAFKHVLEYLYEAAVTEWSTSAPDDRVTRELCYNRQMSISQISAEVENLAR